MLYPKLKLARKESKKVSEVAGNQWTMLQVWHIAI